MSDSVCTKCHKRVAEADTLPGVMVRGGHIVPSDGGSEMEKFLRSADDERPVWYHNRWETRPQFSYAPDVCMVRCGPLRDMTPADEYLDQLEAAFGPLA